MRSAAQSPLRCIGCGSERKCMAGKRSDGESTGNSKHPSAGGETWSADLELGAKVHELIGEYWTQIAGASTGDRFRLLVELAGKLYDLHALMLTGLRSGEALSLRWRQVNLF